MLQKSINSNISSYSAVLLLSVLFCANAAHSQTTDPSLLTLDRIFSSEFIPARLGGFEWLKDGNSFAKLEPSPTIKGAMDLVRYDIETNKRDVLIAAEKLRPKAGDEPLAIQGYEWSTDNRQVLIYTNAQKVWRQYTRGDYWVLDTASGKLTKLGADAKPATLMFAKFSPDGRRVGYVRENDMYTEDTTTGKIIRLTSNGSHTMINGTSDWVNEEEFDLRDCWRWSPDSKSIAFWQFDASGIEDFILLNNTTGLYPSLTRIPYPKAGTQNSAVRVGVVNAGGGPVTWLKTPGDPRNNYIVSVDWTADSREVVLQHMNRLQNTDEVLAADAKTGVTKAILTEKDAAWIDLNLPAMQWIDNGKRFLWISERDGWKRAYSVSRDGSDIKPVTGPFDIINVQGIDQTGGWLYFMASPDDPTKSFLYRAKLDGSNLAERVTPADAGGWNIYNISPNFRWAVQSSSTLNTYSKVGLLNVATKTITRPMVDNAAVQTKLDKIKHGPQEFFRVDIGDGVQLDGWMLKPPDFDPAKKYPVLFYAYSGPTGQTVIDRFGGLTYLWFSMLAQQGYIIASVDNRGTPAPRGREWRKFAYRKMGSVNSADQAAAVKAMTAKMPFMDASRIGIWGWSSGGSAVLDGMFRHPDVYRMGMAVAPGADNRYYDTIYTERYMGLPKDNPEDYRVSSPTTFIDQLKGDLLIIHGTGDDNVHYQSTEYLVNALIAANKPFTIMPYPNRSHDISEGEGTTRHLYELLTRYLHEHLPVNR